MIFLSLQFLHYSQAYLFFYRFKIFVHCGDFVHGDLTIPERRYQARQRLAFGRIIPSGIETTAGSRRCYVSKTTVEQLSVFPNNMERR